MDDCGGYVELVGGTSVASMRLTLKTIPESYHDRAKSSNNQIGIKKKRKCPTFSLNLNVHNFTAED